jgi:hypothetical protein
MCMKIHELLEARRNPDVNNQRGRGEVFKYLQSLDPDTLNRTYVHLSMINKVGMNPTEESTYTEYSFEPHGIFCYTAARYLEWKGDVDFVKDVPFVHVITLKTGHNNIYRGSLQKLRDQMADMYPDIDPEGDPRGRSKTTIFLIKHGYDVIYSGQVGDEHIILNPQSIEKIQTFEVEHIPRGHHAYTDSTNMGEFTWDGPLAGRSHRLDRPKYKAFVDSNEILSHAVEYDLLFNFPDLHKEYIEKVLTPLGKKSKLNSKDLDSIDRKHKALKNRRPYHPRSSDFQSDDDFDNLEYRKGYDNQHNIPSIQAAPKMYRYAANSGKQLTREQEQVMLLKGFFNSISYALAYYKLLNKRGQKPLLSYTEMWSIIQPTIGEDEATKFLQAVKHMFS